MQETQTLYYIPNLPTHQLLFFSLEHNPKNTILTFFMMAINFMKTNPPKKILNELEMKETIQ